MKLRNTGLIMFVALAVAACDATGPADELDTQINEDVALVAADAALDDLQQMAVPIGAASFDGAAPPHTRSRIVTYFEDGVESTAYNPETTDSIRIEVLVSGAVERGNWSASVERTRDLMVTGLGGDEDSRIWNGIGSSDVSRSVHNDSVGERSYDFSADAQIIDVVRGVPRSQNPWPLSGTITRSVVVTIVNGPNGDETRMRDVTIVFDGTQFAAITVNGETFVLDLAARDRDHPIRKR